MTDGERLVQLETEMKAVVAAIAEMKLDVKRLADIAARGGGMLRSILWGAGAMGWIVSAALAFLRLHGG
jgi:hypothetical protein